MPPKNIVVLLDGSWANAVSGGPDTNIAALSRLISSNQQIKFYNPGVGTHVGLVNRYWWGVLGKGVFVMARAAWKFVADNFQEGDKIYIFGYSRGAYAARHLASMIVRHGVKAFHNDIEEGFHEYMENCHKPCESPRGEVEFLGLFDCVPGNFFYMINSKRRYLNNPQLEIGIKVFRHAVSFQERRLSFRPILFERNGHADFAQHWFPGYHGDVGGGKGSSGGLSNFSLWWMMREAFGRGLKFDVIQCEWHHLGHTVGVIYDANPEEEGVCSDYWTTKIGIKWERKNHVTTENCPDQQLRFEQMIKCPLYKANNGYEILCPRNNVNLNEEIWPLFDATEVPYLIRVIKQRIGKCQFIRFCSKQGH